MQITTNLKIKALYSVVPPGINLPAYPGDAGIDLVAITNVEVPARSFMDIAHGFSMEIPEGFFGYVMPRSSSIRRNKGTLLVMASPIDCGYRGEIFTMVRNDGVEPIKIRKGERVSQMVILPFASVTGLEIVEELAPSARSTNGFGSTGK